MKKRVRKKLRLGEFKETGFELDLIFDPCVSNHQMEKTFDDFILFCEINNLHCGGGLHPRDKSMSFYVFNALPRGNSKKYKQLTTEAHRELVYKYLHSLSDLKEAVIFGLVDSWYPPKEVSKDNLLKIEK